MRGMLITYVMSRVGCLLMGAEPLMSMVYKHWLIQSRAASVYVYTRILYLGVPTAITWLSSRHDLQCASRKLTTTRKRRSIKADTHNGGWFVQGTRRHPTRDVTIIASIAACWERAINVLIAHTLINSTTGSHKHKSPINATTKLRPNSIW